MLGHTHCRGQQGWIGELLEYQRPLQLPTRQCSTFLALMACTLMNFYGSLRSIQSMMRWGSDGEQWQSIIAMVVIAIPAQAAARMSVSACKPSA